MNLRKKVDQALADCRRAGQWDPKLPPDLEIENSLCWSGSLWKRAADVLAHCERAVAGSPDDGDTRDSRGVARALTGNRRGAAEDFRAFLEWGPANGTSEETLAKRRQWLAEFNYGRNPLKDPATLAALRRDEL